MSELRSVRDHLAACLNVCTPLPSVRVPLGEALGLATSGLVTSEVTLPPWPNSAMDGYAVMLADVSAGSTHQPVKLPVSQDIAAGSGMPVPLEAGTAARIMTGAPLPPGAEAVVQVEWTDGGEHEVQITGSPAPHMHIRDAGEDVRAGQVVLEAGHVLGPRAIGLLAAIGHAEVDVHARPRVAVMTTGAELTPPGNPLSPGQIYDSNAYSLAAAVTAAGAEATRLGPVPDDTAALAEALTTAAAGHDLVVTTGGISAGAYDVVKGLLGGNSPGAAPKGSAEFVKVAMRPGMPQGIGTITADDGRSVPLVMLPGNPVSSWVSFELFVRPMVRRLAGRADLARPSLVARADTGGQLWRSPRGKQEMLRVLLEPEPHSEVGWLIRRVGAQNSHLVGDLALATALAVVPPTVDQVHDGDLLTCIPLEYEEGPA